MPLKKTKKQKKLQARYCVSLENIRLLLTETWAKLENNRVRSGTTIAYGVYELQSDRRLQF